jgi:hypothetical protein
MKKETLQEIKQFISDFKNDIVKCGELREISELISAEEFEKSIKEIGNFHYLDTEIDGNYVYVALGHNKLKDELVYEYNVITLKNPTLSFTAEFSNE